MYNTREALAYTGKLPEQQNQAAITPQLLDLLALQKVEADKKAAAQQLALTSGQAQPTVAQGLQQRAMQSARQEIAQKMGLAGLSQAQPPAGPMPQQPQQPPQGLAGAPTNLPSEYQGGGIIAFAQGGSGGDAHGRFRQRDDQTDDQPADSGDQGPQMSPQDTAFIQGQRTALERMRDQDPEALAQAAMAQQQAMLNPAREAAIAHKREQQAGLKALYERQIAERPSDLRVALDRMAQNIREPGGFGAAMLGVSPALQAAREGYTKQEITQLNTLSAIDDEIDKAIENNDVSKYNTYVARKKDIETQMQKGVEAGATMADVLERVLQGKQTNYERIQEKKRAQLAEDTRKRELAEAEDRRIRELAKDRLMQLQIARAGAGNRAAEALENRNHTTALSLASAAANKAMADPLTVTKLPPGTTVDELALQYYQKFYNALSSGKGELPAASTPTTRLKFDAQGNQIK